MLFGSDILVLFSVLLEVVGVPRRNPIVVSIPSVLRNVLSHQLGSFVFEGDVLLDSLDLGEAPTARISEEGDGA